MTDRKTMIAASITLGVLFLGVTEPTPAAWDQPAVAHAPTGNHVLVQVQERGGAGGRFQSEPEFPPRGYLEDIEDPPRARADASGGDRFQDPQPPLGGGNQSPVIAPASPVYVPEGLRGGMPSGDPREQADRRGTGSASPGGWGAPAFTAPAGQDTDIPRHDRGDGRIDFPAVPPGVEPRDRAGLPAVPTDRGQRGGAAFPAAGARGDRMPAPGSGRDHQWPLAPPTEGGYRSASDGRLPFDEYPRGGLDPSR